ncbi:hypothetical protein CHQ84_06900 [Francisella noatunensis subsp. orientalis]|uniref:Uncharacterized protein n=1 Tax=Francisella orientalis TaxID=299583 RepID=A0AAW9YR86_9GAMM|nr:Hypothetical protein OOM_1261 [Francisella orientalis str. Toba 04]AHB98241.1 hypothetical protein M973_03985 [Francisella orientalis LADL 07-285A]AKN85384.1 hypothetical protein FNO12_0679 [Francisella orientalis FNO12]AKN86923.1 Hypothetical protein FNO24_0679 [Francisella orientalis FNO24]AKN88461.1 Hypothetical protein FNO190_0679 [Francisella orientalis]
MLTAIFNYRVHLLLHLLDFKSSELPTINRLLTFCYYSIVSSYKTRHHIITKNSKITSLILLRLCMKYFLLRESGYKLLIL